MEGISATRTKIAKGIIKSQKGKILGLRARSGQFDFALLTELPDTVSAMKVFVALGAAAGIGFTTLQAVDVKMFDKLEAGS